MSISNLCLKEDLGIYMPVSPISVPGKAKEQILLEGIFKDMMVKKVSSQHRFMKGKMCLTNQKHINSMTSLMENSE